MKRKLIQFNQDAGGAGGESDAVPFDQVKNLDEVVAGKEVTSAASDEPAGEEQDSGVDPDEEDLSDTGAADTENDDADGDDAPEVKSKKEDPKKKEEPKNLEISDDDDEEEEADADKAASKKKEEPKAADEGAAAGESKELTFISVGEELDIPVAEDTYESFTTAVKSTITKLKEENEALKTNPIKSLSDETLALTFGPDGAFAVKFFMKGGTIQDLINPVSGLEDQFKLTDRERVVNDFIAQGFDKDDAEQEVTFLEESNRFDAYAKKVNKVLEDRHVKAIEEKLKKVLDGPEKEKEDLVALSNREEQLIVDEINARDKIHDLNLTKEAKDKIIHKLKSGIYRKRLKNDPKFMAEMLLNYEFSKAAVKKAVSKTAETVSSEKTKEFTTKVFKIPGTGKNSSGRAASTKTSEVPKDLEGFNSFDPNVKVSLV